MGGCLSCHPTNRIKALKETACGIYTVLKKVYKPSTNDNFQSSCPIQVIYGIVITE